MTSNDFTPFDSMLKSEEQLPVYGLRILEYLDTDGELKYTAHQTGRLDVVRILGLLDLVHGELSERGRRLGRSDAAPD